MGRVSIFIIGTINFIFLILGVIIMCNSLYAHAGASNYCEKHSHWPAIIVGLVMVVVSFVGLIGCCFRDTCLLMIYLTFVFIIIVGIMVFTVFVFMLSINRGKEGRLEDFSIWLQKVTANKQNWNNIKTCFIQSQLCKFNATAEHFHYMKVSPLQLGCCKPPKSCNIYQNVTKEEDCIRWKDGEDLQCFDCDSCKAGFLTNLRNQFKVMVFQNILTILVLFLIYFIGCCARRGIKYRYVAYSAYVKA